MRQSEKSFDKSLFGLFATILVCAGLVGGAVVSYRWYTVVGTSMPLVLINIKQCELNLPRTQKCVAKVVIVPEKRTTEGSK